MYTVKAAFSDLRSDLDPLGARAEEMLGAEAEAALSRERHEALTRATPREREQQQRVERRVHSTLLDFPLPQAAVAAAAAVEAEAAPEVLVDGARQAGVPSGHASQVVGSEGAVSKR